MSNQVLLRCPNCSNTAQHTLLYACNAPSQSYDAEGKLQNDTINGYHELFQCSTCQDVSLYLQMEYEYERNLAYPHPQTFDSSVPKFVASNYYDAKKIQNLSPNAFAVMIRRALEALCDDRGVTSGPLHTRLKKLSDTGEIPAKLAEMTSVLRQLGNAGAHHSEANVTVPTTWIIDDFFRVVIEYVYVAPNKLLTFQKKMAKASSDNMPT